jgi:hypothetical protein
MWCNSDCMNTGFATFHPAVCLLLFFCCCRRSDNVTDTMVALM